MSPSEDGKKKSQDVASISGSSTSSDDSARRRRRRERKEKKRKNGEAPAVNGAKPSAFAQRRNSLAKASRDPRDEPLPKKRRTSVVPEEGAVVKPRSPSPVIDFDGLSRPSRGTRERREETQEQQVERLDRMRGAVRTLLECIGEDPDREGLLDTPSRYAKALLFLTKGYQVNAEDIVNNALFREGHSEMVIVKDIEVFSLCEHHLVPFTGKMSIGYIPNETVIGLSKLPRIAEMFARRLQIQERLTKEVAHAIMEILKPQGVAVVMESSHLCMVMRGVEKTTTSTITSCVLGCFERKSKTRNEFLNLIGINR
ncbi:GTP cyclohydrolase I [Fusarium heterosporum]|uniref:GTP cyclohydrolase 1 n=1 Tax=Fusarium heterosporum TaxID=42747 RepID=A0A8H5TS30_FUSHE|nr:GTP cyclohydrolase I [Fusarium heterosporum]